MAMAVTIVLAWYGTIMLMLTMVLRNIDLAMAMATCN